MTAISREPLALGHRSCSRRCLQHTHEMRERTNCGRGCSFSFFSSMKHYTGKGRNGQDKQKKMCRKTQHVKIDIERGAPIIICRMVAVGENYNSTRDTTRRFFIWWAFTLKSYKTKQSQRTVISPMYVKIFVITCGVYVCLQTF